MLICESDSYVNVSNLWAVGWTKVPIQLLVLLQTNKALRLGLLLLDLLGDCLQFLWVQLGIQGTHLTNRAGKKTVNCLSKQYWLLGLSRQSFRLLKVAETVLNVVLVPYLIFQHHPD